MKRPALGLWIAATGLALASLTSLNITVANGDSRTLVRAGLILAVASLLTALIAAWRTRGSVAVRLVMLLPFLTVLAFAVLDAVRRFGSITGALRW